MSFLLIGTERFSCLGRIQLFHATIPFPSTPQLSYKNIQFLGLTVAPRHQVALAQTMGCSAMGTDVPGLCATALRGCQGWFSSICSFCHDGLWGRWRRRGLLQEFAGGGGAARCRVCHEREVLAHLRGAANETNAVLVPQDKQFGLSISAVCTQGDAETGCP